jgi:hypothetical protein
MGEARRRKLAGSPAEAFRAPIGTLAITLDVEGTDPSTYLLNAAHVDEMDQEVAILCQAVNYYTVALSVAAEFAEAKASQQDEAARGLGMVALWTAFHHPTTGDAMRRKVSAALRDRGTAHITWRFSPTAGLAIALHDRFVDFEAKRPIEVAMIEIGSRGHLSDADLAKMAGYPAWLHATLPDLPINLSIGDYDDDDPELWDIPEVVDYLRRYARASGLHDWKGALFQALSEGSKTLLLLADAIDKPHPYDVTIAPSSS